MAGRLAAPCLVSLQQVCTNQAVYRRCVREDTDHVRTPLDLPHDPLHHVRRIHAAHGGMGAAHPVLHMEPWRTVMSAAVWREMLQQFRNDEAVKALRPHTRTGRPLGGDSFPGKLEYMPGRRLRPLPAGRQRGSQKPDMTGGKQYKQAPVPYCALLQLLQLHYLTFFKYNDKPECLPQRIGLSRWFPRFGFVRSV